MSQSETTDKDQIEISTERKSQAPAWSQWLKLLHLLQQMLSSIFREHRPTPEDARHALRHTGSIAEEIRKVLLEYLRYPNEEVEHQLDYPEGYSYSARSIEEQSVDLQRLFGCDFGINKSWLSRHELPEGAESWFVVPNYRKVGYAEGLKTLLTGLRERWDLSLAFHTHERVHPNEENLESFIGEFERTDHPSPLDTLRVRQSQARKDLDLILVPAQFGLRHAGRSLRRASALFKSNEFALGLFEVASMLYTHPDRITRDGLGVTACADQNDKDQVPHLFCGRLNDCRYNSVVLAAHRLYRSVAGPKLSSTPACASGFLPPHSSN